MLTYRLDGEKGHDMTDHSFHFTITVKNKATKEKVNHYYDFCNYTYAEAWALAMEKALNILNHRGEGWIIDRIVNA
jgi:hypothetical protein